MMGMGKADDFRVLDDGQAPAWRPWVCACGQPAADGQPNMARRRMGAALAFSALLGGAGTARDTQAASIPECRTSRAAALVPAADVETMAQQQYAQMLQQANSQRALAPSNHPQLQRLRFIADRITPHTPACNPRARNWRWEVNLIGSNDINAFCMPGGKIGFYLGILSRLQLDDDEVAMIMGHEVAHALLEHAREQMAKSTGAEALLRGGAALLGLGQLGDLAARGGAAIWSLKFSRTDESEADALGLIMAAQAGYDPRAGVSLWRKMMKAAGGSPPKFLSTHPPSEERIRSIEARLPQVLPTFSAAPKPARRFAPPPAPSSSPAQKP
jgi:predicted Zn-dependent protease